MEKICRLEELVDHFDLKVLTPEVNYHEVIITTRDINRPGIQLTGFLEFYDKDDLK